MQRSALRYCSRFEFKDEEGLLLPRLLEFLSAPSGPRALMSPAVEAMFSVFVESQIPLLIQAVRGLLPNRRVLEEIEDELTTSEHIARRSSAPWCGRCFQSWLKTP